MRGYNKLQMFPTILLFVILKNMRLSIATYATSISEGTK